MKTRLAGTKDRPLATATVTYPPLIAAAYGAPIGRVARTEHGA